MNLNFIEQFDFLEEFDDFGGINLSEKCVNVSSCVKVKVGVLGSRFKDLSLSLIKSPWISPILV